jgi:hypothetical protein
MEKKKILWVVILICAFALIVFGAVVILYMPSRSTGQDLRQSVAMTPATRTDPTAGQSNIDPDSWVRDGKNAPGLDKTAQPTAGDINLTIVNNDTSGANYGTLDVSGLTASQTAIAGSTDALPLAIIPGQIAPTPADASATGATATGANATASGTIASGAIAQTTVITKTAETTATKPKAATGDKATATKQAKPAQAAKPAEKKTVTEYWIQTGSFASKINAEKARETLTARFLSAEIFTKEVSGSTTFRVRVGPYKSKTEAEYWLGTVKEIPSFGGSYVSEVKSKK